VVALDAIEQEAYALLVTYQATIDIAIHTADLPADDEP